MSEQSTTVAAPPLPSSWALILTLGGISMMSGLLVVLAVQITLPSIIQNKKEALERAVFSVIPEASTRSNYLIDSSGLTALGPDDIDTANVFAGYNDSGELVGLAMEASARGYQDVVRILYGYNPDDECIIGFTVLQSTETPGLGDKIETDPGFLANFDCLKASLNDDGTAMANEIVTVKNGEKTDPWQIDGISGATVTSKAIGKALRDSTNKKLPLVARHLDSLRGTPDGD